MKLVNIEHLDNYEGAFLSHMQIDLREKIQNCKLFLIAEVHDKSEVLSCKKAIIMRDADGLCHTKESFRHIDFEIISDDEFEKHPKEYFIDKFICEVCKPNKI